MKKIIFKILTIVIVMTIFATVLVGCSYEKSKDGLKIICTIFPEFDWVKNIVGNVEGVEIILLEDSGVDLHSFQPTADDIVEISTCDMFIYVGGESDEWVDGVLAQKINKDMVVINLLEVLGDKVKNEEKVEGMEGDDDEEVDEHIWLSLKHAKTITSYIAERLGEIDEKNKNTYGENAENYNKKLEKLDIEYQNAVEKATYKTLVFGERFPFRYLLDDYGISYYAAFSGCSAESEASFETIIFLANKINELGLKCILKIDGSKNQIAETIRNNTTEKNQKILTLNSLQSVTKTDVKNGVSYTDIMQKNLAVLIEALN